MNNSIMSDLIALFDDEIKSLKDEIDSLNKLKEKKEKMKDFDTIDKIINTDEDELFSLIKDAVPSFEGDIESLKQYIYFFKCGINNAMFRKTDRYQQTFVILTTITDSFKKISSVDVDKGKDVRDKLKTISSIKKGLLLNPPKCDISSFDSVDFILNDENLTDEEKVSYLAILTKASYNFYVEKEKIAQEEVDRKIEEEIRRQEEEIKDKATRKEQSKDNDDTKFGEIMGILDSEQTSKVELKKVILSDDKKEILDKIRQKREKNADKILSCSKSMLETFDSLGNSLISGENTLDVIKESFTKDDFEKFCIYLSGKKLIEIDEFLSNSYEDSDLETVSELIDFDLSLIDEVSKNINDEYDKEELKDERIDEEQSRKLIFYGYNSTTSEFEKNLDSFSIEKVNDTETLIDKLENGNLSNSQKIFANSSLKFNEIHNGNVFVVYRVMPKNHILVVCAEPIEYINKQQIERKLSNVSTKEIKNLEKTIDDGTLEYRKVIDRNNEILSNVKESFKSKRGLYE